ncbi:hypothetical protein [Gloeothece verrucosa]|uniref:Uncharacterized protein n=1 Tax=Gloeothece verrucosa (strain PCC 7822) TaxID=497965 RepID=E0UDX3_GLOV7|nr:hypothetical protein [Gloeothece verrucosa]ADN12977.1 hypothetical protein Cyan7822_0966 [Gloeothece verrucosa PCC 7822]
MLATINTVLFPLFLFAVYFCAACIVIHISNKPWQYNQEIPLTTSEVNLQLEKITENVRNETEENFLVEITPTPELANSSTKTEMSEIPKPIIVDNELLHFLDTQTETIINKLNKRQSRKLCKPLGIQQKNGKVEKSLTLIKAEILSHFKDEPQKVITVITEQLPEFLSVAHQA